MENEEPKSLAGGTERKVDKSTISKDNGNSVKKQEKSKTQQEKTRKKPPDLKLKPLTLNGAENINFTESSSDSLTYYKATELSRERNGNCLKMDKSDFKMDVDPLVEMMSSTLTDVVMHSELNLYKIVQITSDVCSNQKRNQKRSQTCVTRTLSLSTEIPRKKMSDRDKDSQRQKLQIAVDERGDITLSQAITQKYMDSLEDVPCTSSIVIVSTPRSPLPPTLVLNDCDISCVGDLEPVKPICQGVKELDLAQNKITDLNEVQKIFNTMQRLTFLNLSSNDFSECCSFPMETKTLEKMKWLVLNCTFIPWNPLETMLQFMPNLEELYLSLNNYKVIGLSEEIIMPNVHVLHISGNPLEDFHEVVRLGRKFPGLETLVMADCLIAAFGDETVIGAAFEKLQSLNISNNNIDLWEEIDKLRFFPALSDLRLLGQPLLERYNEKERRQLVIGRLGNVERLNGSRISDEEKLDAERAFIRYYMQTDDSAKPQRYSELVEKHGQLDPLVNIDLRPQTVVEVLLRYGDKTEMRTLNVRQTVMSFKSSLREFTGLSPAQMKLYYQDKEMEAYSGPEEWKYNSKMIYTYNIRDGDEFYIDKKR